MWKKYIDILKLRDENYTHQEYCLWFSGYFSYKINSLDDFSKELEKENGDLLPISKNLTDMFYQLNIEAIVNLIYHINELENLDFIVMNSSKQNNLETLFCSTQSSSYIYQLFSFDNEILLSDDNENATLLFLFLYFLPQHKSKDSLYHSRKKIPLISCNKITFNHFEMLLYLMSIYDKPWLESLSEKYNLNLILLEDFCQNSTEIYTIIDKEEWYNILPLNKMRVLFDQNCSFENYHEYSKNKAFRIAPTLLDFLNLFQKELSFLQLKQKLTMKGQFNKKEKIIKI